MKKKVKVIMLPTDKIVEDRHGYFTDGISKFTSHHPRGKEHLTILRSMNGMEIPNPQHLYFVSDGEIKVGDWCVHLSRGYIFKVYNFGESNGSVTLIPSENNLPEDLEFLLVDCKKVVATTDKSLVYLTNNGRVGYKIPQIPQEFIENYCRIGGIDEVEIEYIDAYTEDRVRRFYGKPKVKVDSNNCVMVHPIKDSWSREEVEKLIESVVHDFAGMNTYDDDNLNRWINENL